MAMSNDDIYSRATVRAERTSSRSAEALGPVIDQEGREIPQQGFGGNPGEGFGAQARSFRFAFESSGANPFGPAAIPTPA